ASLDLCAATAPAAAACLVDQHWQQADTAIADEVGALVATDDTGLQQCQAAVVKEAGKFLDAKAKVLARCLAKRQKVCGTASPSIRCFGGSASGPKVEADTIASIDKGKSKLQAKIARSCSDADAAALHACGSSATELGACLACGHGNGADLAIASDYTSVKVATPATTIQAIVDAADPGDTVLLEPGTYQEVVTLRDRGLTLLGHKTCPEVTPTCGTHTMTGRAIILPPTPNATNGVYACGSRLARCAPPAAPP